MSIDAPLVLQAAASAAGAQQYPKATLYVVATPIGNLADISLRALHLLAICDAVACEDTRVTSGLLRAYGLDKPLLSVHEHNESEAAARVIERLARGERVAYASDAGTPAVSDPGARLVALVRAAGYRVMPLPGASSVVVALSAAGDALSTSFRFAGFLPTKAGERDLALRQLATLDGSTVIFEAPHRIEAVAVALAGVLGARPLTVCRELSKQFEQIETLAADTLPTWLAADPQRLRGEFVLVIHAPPPAATQPDALDAATERLLAALVAALPLKQAVTLAVEATGAPRNALYARALALRQATDADSDDA